MHTCLVLSKPVVVYQAASGSNLVPFPCLTFRKRRRHGRYSGQSTESTQDVGCLRRLLIGRHLLVVKALRVGLFGSSDSALRTFPALPHPHFQPVRALLPRLRGNCWWYLVDATPPDFRQHYAHTRTRKLAESRRAGDLTKLVETLGHRRPCNPSLSFPALRTQRDATSPPPGSLTKPHCTDATDLREPDGR